MSCFWIYGPGENRSVRDKIHHILSGGGGGELSESTPVKNNPSKAFSANASLWPGMVLVLVHLLPCWSYNNDVTLSFTVTLILEAHYISTFE